MIKINKPYVGMIVGKCKNCGQDVEIRQPWLSEIPVINDGWIILHCLNEKCHNVSGWEMRIKDIETADFVDWSEQFIEEDKEYIAEGNIIQFPVRD